MRDSDKLKPALIQISDRQINYFRITAINRFFDNIEKALKGDRECMENLLAEDLQDAREYYEPVFRAIQQAEQ